MRQFNFRFIAVVAIGAAIALSACSSSSKTSSDTVAPTDAPTTTAAPTPTTGGQTSTTVARGGAATVAIADSKYGKILVDGKGMTLYVDENDKPGKPACTGACLQSWPPVPAPDTFVAGAGLKGANYAAVTLSDGTKQLTVKGSPLYTWTADKKPGDVTGQDVNGFYVVQTNGTKYDPPATDGS